MEDHTTPNTSGQSSRNDQLDRVATVATPGDASCPGITGVGASGARLSDGDVIEWHQPDLAVGSCDGEEKGRSPQQGSGAITVVPGAPAMDEVRRTATSVGDRVPDFDLMSAFLRLIEPSPVSSARFVPKGSGRAGYDTTGKKDTVRLAKEQKVGGICWGFANGRDLIGLPTSPEELTADPFLARGDLMGVALKHTDDMTNTLVVDIDGKQLATGGLPEVRNALDTVGVRYLIELSASGVGYHLWIPLAEALPASSVLLALQRLLPRNGKDGAYDLVKPSKGDGGLIIVPHFFGDGRSSLCSIGEDGALTTLAKTEALEVIAGFVQTWRPDLSGAAVTAGPRTRGRRSSKKGEPVDLSNVWPALTGSAIEAEKRLLEFALKYDAGLRQAVEVASGDKAGGRSEAIWQVLARLLQNYMFHVSAVEMFCESWPRFQKTPFSEEVSRLLKKRGTVQFLKQYWALRVRLVVEPERSPYIRDVCTLLRSEEDLEDNDSSLKRVEAVAAELRVRSQGDVRDRLMLLDFPPGSGKSTVLEPMLAAKVVEGQAGSASVFRERRNDAIAVEHLFNRAGRDGMRSDRLRQLRLTKPIRNEDYLRRPGEFVESGRMSNTEPWATAVVGYKLPAQCPLAVWRPQEGKRLLKKARGLRRTPCYSGCPQVDCRQHPEFLKDRVFEIIVGTHKAVRIPPTDVAIFDERPQDVLRLRGVVCTKVRGHWTVQPVDRLREVCLVMEFDDAVAALDSLHTALVDVAQAASTGYRVKETPRHDLGDVEELAKELLNKEFREKTLAALEKEYREDMQAVQYQGEEAIDPANLLRDDLAAIDFVFDGQDKLWTFDQTEMKVFGSENRWQTVLDRGERGVVVMDGTITAHHEYLGVPPGVAVTGYLSPRPWYPRLRLTFDAGGINKGRLTGGAPNQAEYALNCVRRLISDGFWGDVLVVTHKAAEQIVLDALRNAVDVKKGFDLADDEATTNPDKRGTIHVSYFGALKGENRYQNCASVIVTHHHNLPWQEQAARALCLFPALRVPTTHGEAQSLPRQWTATAKGAEGKNARKPALMEHLFRKSHCPELNYINRSQVATETVQAVMRSRLRWDPGAGVRVFFPLGSDFPLAAAMLRQLPGANIEISDFVRGKEKGAVPRSNLQVPESVVLKEIRSRLGNVSFNQEYILGEWRENLVQEASTQNLGELYDATARRLIDKWAEWWSTNKAHYLEGFGRLNLDPGPPDWDAGDNGYDDDVAPDYYDDGYEGLGVDCRG